MIVDGQGSDGLVTSDLLDLVIGPALGYQGRDHVMPEGVAGDMLEHVSLPGIPLRQALQGPIRFLEDLLIPANVLTGDELSEKNEACLIEEDLASLCFSLLLYACPEASILEVHILRGYGPDFSKSPASLDQKSKEEVVMVVLYGRAEYPRHLFTG